MDAGLTLGEKLKSGWAFKRRTSEYLRKSVTLGNPNILPMKHFWLGYRYTLYRWNGTAWVKAKLREYSGTDWLLKPLKTWDGSDWQEVDNFDA